jgi:hypothetical protein
LSAGSLLHETPETLPAEELLSFCQKIVPENCFVERNSESAWAEMEKRYGKEDCIGGESGSGDSFVFGKQTEKWYGIDYYVSPIGDEDVKSWETVSDKSLHLPHPNRFIPRSLELCDDLPDEARNGQRIEKPIEPPKLIINDPNVGE